MERFYPTQEAHDGPEQDDTAGLLDQIDVLTPTCFDAFSSTPGSGSSRRGGSSHRAGPHERASTRTTYRNGHRERILDTGSGRLELQIPKLRSGSFFPSLPESRRRIDRALMTVVQEAYVLAISSRKVDDLMADSVAAASAAAR